MSTFKHQLAYYALRASALLPLPFSRLLGRLVGRLNYWMKTRSALVTRENLDRCFPDMPDAEKDALTRESLMQTGMAMLETGAVWLRDYRWLQRHIVSVEGRSLLDKALAADKGVMILAPHLGNWEVLGLYLSTAAPITSLFQPPDHEQIGNIIRQSREKLGATLVPTNRQGVASLLKTLKQGGFSAILPDQVPDPSGGEFAPFYGVPALTMTLVHNLVQRTGCQVLMAFAKRVPGGFTIVFQGAEEGIGDTDLATSLGALNRNVEACVNTVPDQYQWEYKRFRKQPPGTPKPYRFKKR